MSIFLSPQADTSCRMDEKCLVINSEMYKSIVYKSEVLLLPNTHIPLLFLCLFGSGLGEGGDRGKNKG
jgi:hypothetical protein